MWQDWTFHIIMTAHSFFPSIASLTKFEFILFVKNLWKRGKIKLSSNYFLKTLLKIETIIEEIGISWILSESESEQRNGGFEKQREIRNKTKIWK